MWHDDPEWETAKKIDLTDSINIDICENVPEEICIDFKLHAAKA